MKLLRHKRVICLHNALFTKEEEERVTAGILVAVAIERHGIANIRPIRNQSNFSSGLRKTSEWVLWYEYKNATGWTSSMIIPSKMHLLTTN